MVTPAPDSPHRLVAQTKAQLPHRRGRKRRPEDPQAKVALRTALEAAKLPAEVEVYPAAHGWCPPDSQVYDAAQSERAWARLLATFKQALA
jgi:carboxymethylenebutenolidase